MGVWIEEKPKGSGLYRVGIYHNGKQRYLKAGSEKEALELKQVAEAEIGGRQRPRLSGDPVMPTLQEYYQLYFEARIDTLAVKPSTRRTYLSVFKNHILPVFGGTAIDRITDTDVERFIGKLGKADLAYNTIKGIIDNFSGLFTYAVRKKVVPMNPVKDKSEYFAHARAQIEIRPLTGDQGERFLSAASTFWPEYYPVFVVALHTGLRLGEILGLQPGDFDFVEQHILVQRTICAHGGKRATTTKSTRKQKTKSRKVEISRDVSMLIKHRIALNKETAMRLGIPVPEWLFFTRSGRPMDGNRVSSFVLKDVCAKAGLPAIRFHDLRHSYAAYVLRDTKDILFLKEQLGHSTIKVTMDTYGHLMPDRQRAEIAFPTLKLGVV